MDIEELKDIIVDDCEVIVPIEQTGDAIESLDVPSTVPGPETELIKAEQLDGNEPLTPEKKKLAAALAAAQELGIIEDEQPYEATTLAETSDRILEDLRIDYQTGTGALTPEEAYESSLDRKAARFVANVNRIIDSFVDRVGEHAHVSIQVWAQQALDWVEEQWPQTGAFRPAAEHIVEVLDYKVVPFIIAGARKIAERVKDAVSSGTEKVKVAAKRVTDFVKGLFS